MSMQNRKIKTDIEMLEMRKVYTIQHISTCIRLPPHRRLHIVYSKEEYFLARVYIYKGRIT